MDSSSAVLKNRASGYLNADTLADYVDMSVLAAAGGMYATTEDLLRWDQALYTDKLLSQDLMDEIFTPHTEIIDPANPEKPRYGYGWFIEEFAGHKRIDHGGGLEGFRSELHRFPDDKVTIIVLSNREDQDAFAITEKIATMIFVDK